jgi:hypothetical protein
MAELNPQPLPPGEEAWKHPSNAPPWWPQLLLQLHFPVSSSLYTRSKTYRSRMTKQWRERSGRNITRPKARHCEELRSEAIQRRLRISGLLHYFRSDHGTPWPPRASRGSRPQRWPFPGVMIYGA